MWDRAGAARLLTLLDEAEEHAEPMASIPARIGPYIIERVIGGGAAGTVYLGHKPGSSRAVAVKLMRQALGESLGASRVWRELDVLAELALDCVPRVLDYGTHEGRLYIASEFVEGRTLEEHCEAERLGRRERVDLLRSAAMAVQEVHECGVIHRDLKPLNIVVVARSTAQRTNGERAAELSPRIVILDFGLARVVQGMDDAAHAPDVTVTAEGVPVGTPAYMAPEQARGDPGASRSVRVDVYALGSIAYRLLMGATVHDMSGTLHEVLRRVAEDEPRSVRGLDATMPRDLGRVLEKACANEPGKRYASAREFGEELGRWLNGEAVEAGGSPGWKRAVGWVGRHPLASTAALCALFIAVSASVASGLVWVITLRPDHLETVGHGTLVRLNTRAGAVVKAWSTGVPAPFVFAQEVTGRSGQKLAVLVYPTDSTGTERGQMCVADYGAPGRWRWTTADASRKSIPPGEDPRTELYVRTVQIADVFDDDGVPEIIAVGKLANWGHYCIRVYSLERGEVLYEAWHWGDVRSILWLKESGLLVGSGVTNRDDLRLLTLPECGRKQNFPCVFAVRPDRDRIREWIGASRSGSDGGAEAESAEWYFVTGSPAAACAEYGGSVGLHGLVEPLRTSNGPGEETFYANMSAEGQVMLVYKLDSAGNVHSLGASHHYSTLQLPDGRAMPPAEEAGWRRPEDVLSKRVEQPSRMDETDSRATTE